MTASIDEYLNMYIWKIYNRRNDLIIKSLTWITKLLTSNAPYLLGLISPDRYQVWIDSEDYTAAAEYSSSRENL